MKKYLAILSFVMVFTLCSTWNIVQAKTYNLTLEKITVPANSIKTERIDLDVKPPYPYTIWFIKLDKWYYHLPETVITENDSDIIETWGIGYTKHAVIFTRIIQNTSPQEKESYSWDFKVIPKKCNN